MPGLPGAPSDVSLRYKADSGAIEIEIGPALMSEQVTGYAISYTKGFVGTDGIWLNRNLFTCSSKNRLEDTKLMLERTRRAARYILGKPS